MQTHTATMILVASLCAAGATAQATRPAKPAEAFDHSLFDTILQRTVRDGSVDYLIIRTRHWNRLKLYLDRMAEFNPEKLGTRDRLALYINLYNATMIRAVIERFRTDYSPAEDSFAVFKLPLVRIGGKTITLDDLENKVIRPMFHEPRIHVALVCAARSCPPLLPRAYRGGDLDKTLDDNMRAFINDDDTPRNRIDVKNRGLQLSQIFNWYADDFGGKDRLTEYINRYTDQNVSGFAVTFIDYDWTLNFVPPRAEQWIRITDPKPGIVIGAGGHTAWRKETRTNQVYQVLTKTQEGYIVRIPLVRESGFVPFDAAERYPPKPKAP